MKFFGGPTMEEIAGWWAFLKDREPRVDMLRTSFPQEITHYKERAGS